MKEMIPGFFFVTSGKAISSISRMNSFDLALNEASISQCNLVKVSSIIPSDCNETNFKFITPGSITYAVISKAEGQEGTISAGLAWGVQKNQGYGIVAEDCGRINKNTIKQRLAKKLNEMARIRKIDLVNPKFKIETLNVPPNNYGCAIVALVYIF